MRWAKLVDECHIPSDNNSTYFEKLVIEYTNLYCVTVMGICLRLSKLLWWLRSRLLILARHSVWSIFCIVSVKEHFVAVANRLLCLRYVLFMFPEIQEWLVSLDALGSMAVKASYSSSWTMVKPGLVYISVMYIGKLQI